MRQTGDAAGEAAEVRRGEITRGRFLKLIGLAGGGLAGVALPFGQRAFAPALAAQTEILFNVSAYGAKGDGVQDDAPRIQAALDAAAAAGGGVVIFPPGIYQLNRKGLVTVGGNTMAYHVKLRSNLTLLGSGRGQTILRVGAPDGSPFFGTELSRVVIRDMTLDGNHAANNGAGIKMLASKNIDMIDVDTVAQRIGFQFLGCSDVTLTRCYAANQTRDSSGDDSRGFSFGDQDLPASRLSGTTRIQLIDCRAENVQDNGFYIFSAGPAADIELINCEAVNCHNVGFRSNGSAVSFINCVAQYSGIIGFDLINNLGTPSRCRLVRCSASGSGQNGIRLYGAESCDVIACTTTDNSTSKPNAYSGILVGDFGGRSSTRNSFVGCVSYNSRGAGQKYGYETAGASGGNTIIGCDFHGNQAGDQVFAKTDRFDLTRAPVEELPEIVRKRFNPPA